MFAIDPIYIVSISYLMLSFYYADFLITSGIFYVISRIMRYAKQDYRTAAGFSFRSTVPGDLLFTAVCVLVYVFDPYSGDFVKTVFILGMLLVFTYLLKLFLLTYLYRKTYQEKLGKTIKGLAVSVYLLAGTWALIILTLSLMWFFILSVIFSL
jgi:hypothetical protein